MSNISAILWQEQVTYFKHEYNHIGGVMISAADCGFEQWLGQTKN
jgi:hypothetical protein